MLFAANVVMKVGLWHAEAGSLAVFRATMHLQSQTYGFAGGPKIEEYHKQTTNLQNLMTDDRCQLQSKTLPSHR